MTTAEIPVEKPHRAAMKLWRIGRHRVTRWFRPPEAELLRRQQIAPPHPVLTPSSLLAGAHTAGSPIGRATAGARASFVVRVWNER